MSVPNTYTDQNETGCCGVPNIGEWNEKEITLENQYFIRMYTKSFLHMPINMSKVMANIQKTAELSGSTMPPQQAMILSREISPWKAEQLYAVTKPVEGADNVTLNETFITKVFEGSYSNARKWHNQLIDYVKSNNKKVKNLYFFYTTCPKCAKHYGKNYVIGLASIAKETS